METEMSQAMEKWAVEQDLTVAETFWRDPQVQRALYTLKERLAHHQSKIQEPRPAIPRRIEAYRKTIEDFSALRSGKLFFPYLGSGIGNGVLVELADGSVKYDFINGIGAHHLGHSHPKLCAAAMSGALGDTVMQGNLQQNTVSYTFVKKLLELANVNGAGFEHAFLTTTGVMAGENALKITMQKTFPARRVLAFDRCFAGRTMAFSQITDKPKFREGLPATLEVHYVPFFDENDGAASIDRSVGVLRQHLARYPGEFAAMIFELVQGEGGFYAAPAEFHRALIDVLKEHNVAVLVDEVQTFARTPALFAFQYYGLDALVDVVWIGKASQVCATLFRQDFAPRPGLLSQTFTGSSSSIHAGLAVLMELESGDYFGERGKIALMHAHFRKHLERLRDKYPEHLSGPFGVGAMVAFTPFGGEASKVQALVKTLYEHGVMSFVAGANPTRLRFLLPVGAVREQDIDAVVEILDRTLAELI